jgi:hypothetical protein
MEFKMKIKYIVRKPNGYIFTEIFSLYDLERGYVSSWFKNNFIGDQCEIFRYMYTGRKDRFGRKIFVGDILKCLSENSIGDVTFYDGCFESDCGGVGYKPMCNYDESDIEIIGNIHEN